MNKLKSILPHFLRKKNTKTEPKSNLYVISGKPFQYRMRTIEIIGSTNKEDVDEAHDAIVSFLVDKFFKGKDCRVIKFKGKTYIRLKEKNPKPIKKQEKKKDWGFYKNSVPYIEINGHKHIVTLPMLQEYTSRSHGRIAKEYSRNSDRYVYHGKKRK